MKNVFHVEGVQEMLNVKLVKLSKWIIHLLWELTVLFRNTNKTTKVM